MLHLHYYQNVYYHSVHREVLVYMHLTRYKHVREIDLNGTGADAFKQMWLCKKNNLDGTQMICNPSENLMNCDE